MLSVINKNSEPRLTELTDLIKETAEDSYFFDEYLINVSAELKTSPVLFGEAGIFVDKKIMDIRFNEVPFLTLRDLADLSSDPQERRGYLSPQPAISDPYLNTVLRLGPVMMLTANARLFNLRRDMGDYQSLIYSLGDNISYSQVYKQFCSEFRISPKILDIPLFLLFLVANTPNYKYYISKELNLRKSAAAFLLHHEIGHNRICPVSDEIGRTLQAAVSEVVTPLEQMRTNYANFFSDVVVNISNMLNGPQREEFKCGYNLAYQFGISAPSITNARPSVLSLLFNDLTIRLGQQEKDDCPDWVEQMFPKEYELIKPVSIKLVRSLAEDSELAEKMYSQQAAKEDIGIFYRRIRDKAGWDKKIRFFVRALNNLKEPSPAEREKMLPMPDPRLPLLWAFTDLKGREYRNALNAFAEIAAADSNDDY